MPTGYPLSGNRALSIIEGEKRELSLTLRKALRAMAGGMTAETAAHKYKIQVNPAFWDFIESRRFRQELNSMCEERIEITLVPLALAAIERALHKDAPIRAQIDAARIVLNRGGFPERPWRGDGPDVNVVENMSRDELHAFVKSAESKLADLAMQVNAPQTEGDVVQPIDSTGA
jgi:hypothetical protein